MFLFAAIVQWPVRPARPGSLLRAHIAKEDDCLASVVHRAFSDEDLESLTEQFEELERREIGERTFERYAAIVEALEARHGDGDPSA